MASMIKEPAMNRKTLIFTAGVIWIVVGSVLGIVALVWLSTYQARYYILVAVAIMIGFLVSRHGFSHIQRKNVDRIRSLSPHKEKICIFAFQAIQSYLLVLLMMAMGYALRALPVPHFVLATLYLIIATALWRSGLDYLRASWSLSSK
jgi:hypothetical protein